MPKKVEPTTVKAGEGFTGIGMPENDIFYFHHRSRTNPFVWRKENRQRIKKH